MMGSGLKIKLKDMESIFMQMDLSIKGHGKMTSKMAKEKRNGQTVHLIKVSIKMGISMGKERLLGLMLQATQVRLKTI